MNIIKDGHVFESKEVKTATQIATVTTYLCPQFKTALTYVLGKVTAEYQDYSGSKQITYDGEIIFEFEGEQQIVHAVAGMAEIPFVAVDAGTYVVRTVNPDIANGEVTINA